MEFLPVAIHAPRQRPAVERNDGLVVGTSGRKDRRLHRVGPGGPRLGDGRRLDAPAHRARTRKHCGRAEKTSARNHAVLLSQCLPDSPDDAAIGFVPSFLLPDLPPPATAALRSAVASQKSRFAWMAVRVGQMRWRASASREKTSICIAL